MGNFGQKEIGIIKVCTLPVGGIDVGEINEGDVDAKRAEFAKEVELIVRGQMSEKLRAALKKGNETTSEDLKKDPIEELLQSLDDLPKTRTDLFFDEIFGPKDKEPVEGKEENAEISETPSSLVLEEEDVDDKKKKKSKLWEVLTKKRKLF